MNSTGYQRAISLRQRDIMNRDKAKKILAFFGEIDGRIAFNAQLINSMEDKYYSLNSRDEPDGMPKAKHRTTSPTESVALNIPQAVSEAIRHWREENERLYKLKTAIAEELIRLPQAQRTVVYDFYVHGYKWIRIAQKLNYSERQCQNIRNIALNKLSRNFSNNKRVAEYDYPE